MSKTTKTGIEWTTDAFGNTTLARGGRQAVISPCGKGTWLIAASAGGCGLRAFSGKTYTTLRGAFKAAEAWLSRDW